MALGIAAQAVANPELETFKKTVVETSRKYAKKHNLCGVVDEALKEMGIDQTANKVTATAKVLIEAEVTVAVDELDFAGLGEQEELNKASELFGSSFSVTLQGGSVREVKSLVTSLEPADKDGVLVNGLYNGYIGKYTSNEGRVLHLFPADTNFNASVPSVRRSAYWESGDRAYLHALCRDSNMYYVQLGDLLDTSARATGRICVKCKAKADKI